MCSFINPNTNKTKRSAMGDQEFATGQDGGGHRGPPNFGAPHHQNHDEGSATMRPVATTPHMLLTLFVRTYWWPLLLGSVVLYFLLRHLWASFKDYRDNRPVVRSEEQLVSNHEGLLAARLRQQQLAAVSSANDTEVRAARLAAAAEEARIALEEREGRSFTGGRRLGSTAAAAVAAPRPGGVPQPQPRPPAQPQLRPRGGDDDDDDANGPRRRLPKLSGGDRQSWEAQHHTSSGDGARNNYFKRDCGPKGG